MEDLQPVKKIKKAVQYVAAVKVEQDDVIVLADEFGSSLRCGRL